MFGGASVVSLDTPDPVTVPTSEHSSAAICVYYDLWVVFQSNGLFYVVGRPMSNFLSECQSLVGWYVTLLNLLGVCSPFSWRCVRLVRFVVCSFILLLLIVGSQQFCAALANPVSKHILFGELPQSFVIGNDNELYVPVGAVRLGCVLVACMGCQAQCLLFYCLYFLHH